MLYMLCVVGMDAFQLHSLHSDGMLAAAWGLEYT